MRSRFAFIWVLLTALIAGLAAYIAYGAGVATHLATTAGPDGAAYYYHPFYPFFGFGLLIPILFLFLLFWFLRPRRWMGGGWGGHGMRGGFPLGIPPQLEDRLREWHSRAHGGPSSEPAPKPPADGTSTGA